MCVIGLVGLMIVLVVCMKCHSRLASVVVLALTPRCLPSDHLDSCSALVLDE